MGLDSLPVVYRRMLILPVACGLALTLFLGITLALAKSPETQFEPDLARALIRDLDVGLNGLSFSLISPKVTQVEGEFSVAGLGARIQESGQPALPFYTTLVLLPPEAEFDVQVKGQDNTATGGIDIAPVARLTAPDLAFEKTHLGNNADYPPVEELVDPPFYDANHVYPDHTFEVSEPFYYRDLRLVRLSIFPYRYNPVTKELLHTGRIDVALSYTQGSKENRNPLAADRGVYKTIEPAILNPDQIHLWRSLPKELDQKDVSLPVGVPSFKIEVDSSGIFEITHADLVASGMPSTTIDSNALQLIYLGSPVAIELDDGDDGFFGYGDRFRFYGWGFDGPRFDRQYIDNNVFWLLTSGSLSETAKIDSVNGPLRQLFLSSTTYEEDVIWFSGYTDKWELFPNEPDAWYAASIVSSGGPASKTFSISLPNPAQSSHVATYTVELGSFDDQYLDYMHTVSVSLQGSPYSSTYSWSGEQNVNITGTVPISYLNDGLNYFDVEVSTDGPYVYMALNRITVDYARYTRATDNKLRINDSGIGPRTYDVSGFQTNSPSQMQAWDITDRLHPKIINPGSYSVTSGGLIYTVSFGLDGPDPRTIFLTAAENIQKPIAIDKYTAPDLNPPSGGAEWVAISYGGFITEVARLAQHRSDPTYSGLSVQVVDVADVINQFGYGLPVPSAINNYISYTLFAWSPAPKYLTLVGDSTLDPRHIRSDWHKEQYVPTYLEFVDRYQGQVPADLGFSLLVGNDLFPDIAVGRLPASTSGEAAAIIDKIITYEVNLRTAFGWMENLLFLADDPDAGGNFCIENQTVQNAIPSSMNTIDLCITENPSPEDTIAVRKQLFTYTNEIGALFINYRGHGGYNTWAGFPEPLLYLKWGHSSLWNNPNKPVVIITGDCLDGNFALPYDYDGIGEVFLRQEGSGSVAHWGSSGLGLAYEHTLLGTYFYQGLFSAGQTMVGDAVNYAKIMFLMSGGHPSVPYTFSLLGDPAMDLMRPSISLAATSEQSVVETGDTIELRIEVANQGIYPGAVAISSTLPAGFSYVGAESSVDVQTQLVGNQVIFNIQYGEEAVDKGIPRNASAVITFQAYLTSGVESGNNMVPVEVTTPGLEAWPGDESDDVSFLVLANKIYLPFIRRP